MEVSGQTEVLFFGPFFGVVDPLGLEVYVGSPMLWRLRFAAARLAVSMNLGILFCNQSPAIQGLYVNLPSISFMGRSGSWKAERPSGRWLTSHLSSLGRLPTS